MKKIGGLFLSHKYKFKMLAYPSNKGGGEYKLK